MAKIDTSKITGYDTMSAEEKLAALEAMELDEPDYSGWVKKDVFDKASSEIAGYKKQLRDRMTEEEAAKAKAAEDMATIMSELETLRAEKALLRSRGRRSRLHFRESIFREVPALAIV